MAQAVPINRTVQQLMAHSTNTPVVRDPWLDASPKQQQLALQREAFIRPVVEHLQQGLSTNVAVRNLQAKIDAGHLSATVQQLIAGLSKNGKPPGRSTILGWVKRYREAGINGLVDKHTGRVRQDRGWEAVATQLYNIPSKPSFSAVAGRLRDEYGFVSATDSAVRRYLKALPATLNTHSPARLGKHYYQQNISPYKCRDVSVLDVGEVYEGDGHTVDAYIAHPSHGGPWRPELTVWIDVRSRYIAGWYLSEAESSISTLFALSHALITHDHVPAWVHIDNGSGYKSKLMSDKSTGYYERFNITPTVAIPGNSRGKGLVEHWFRTYRDHFDKFWNGGQDYCGHDMADEVNMRMGDAIRQGKRKLRSFDEYRNGIANFIDTYNNRTTKTLDGKSPAQVWADLKPVAVGLPAAAVIRPATERVAQRCTVALHNRKYENKALAQYEGRTVQVEYDIHTDDRVWILDDKGRLICEAELKTKVAWLPESRLVEARNKREKGRIKRLEKKIDLVRLEESHTVTSTEQLAALDEFDAAEDNDFELPEPEGAITLDLDIYDDELGDY